MDDFNPYAVTTELPSIENNFVGAPAEFRGRRACEVLIKLAIPLMIVGAGLAVFDIETIVGSGPVMFLYTIPLLIFTRSTGLRRFRWFGIFCFVFPLCVFMLIWLNGWTPQQAQLPIGSMICIAVVCATVALAFGLAKLRDHLADAELAVIAQHTRNNRTPFSKW